MCISRKIWQEVLTIFDLSIWESSLVNGWLIWWLVPFWPPKKTKESPHLHIRVAQRQHMYTPRGCLPWCRGIPMGFMGKSPATNMDDWGSHGLETSETSFIWGCGFLYYGFSKLNEWKSSPVCDCVMVLFLHCLYILYTCFPQGATL